MIITQAQNLTKSIDKHNFFKKKKTDSNLLESDSNLLMNPENGFKSAYKGFESVDEHKIFPENGFESA